MSAAALARTDAVAVHRECSQDADRPGREVPPVEERGELERVRHRLGGRFVRIVGVNVGGFNFGAKFEICAKRTSGFFVSALPTARRDGGERDRQSRGFVRCHYRMWYPPRAYHAR